MMKLLITGIMILLLAAFFLISQHELSLKEKESVEILGEKYYQWLNNTFENIKVIFGDALKMRWCLKLKFKY